jgi:hypothetical protein
VIKARKSPTYQLRVLLEYDIAGDASLMCSSHSHYVDACLIGLCLTPANTTRLHSLILGSMQRIDLYVRANLRSPLHDQHRHRDTTQTNGDQLRCCNTSQKDSATSVKHSWENEKHWMHSRLEEALVNILSVNFLAAK